MTPHTTLHRTGAALLATGGLLWVVKFVVIAATDGATSSAPELTTAVLYLAAVASMAAGFAVLGVAVLAGRHPALRVLGALGGLIAWWLTYLVVESVAQAVVGDTDPVWLGDEIGIVVTGALLLGLGLLLLRPRPAVLVSR